VANYGQGRIYNAKAAKQRGIIDHIGTFADVLTGLSGHSATSGRLKCQVGAKINLALAMARIT
jgi:ClpP class serine protease